MNPERGEVSIALGGRTRILRFNIDAICQMEERLGIAIGQRPWAKNDPFRKGLRGIRALLWAAMLHADPDFTEEQAGELVNEALQRGGKAYAELLRALADAYNAFFPEPEAQGKANGAIKNAPRADGENSGDKPPALV